MMIQEHPSCSGGLLRLPACDERRGTEQASMAVKDGRERRDERALGGVPQLVLQQQDPSDKAAVAAVHLITLHCRIAAVVTK